MTMFNVTELINLFKKKPQADVCDMANENKGIEEIKFYRHKVYKNLYLDYKLSQSHDFFGDYKYDFVRITESISVAIESFERVREYIKQHDQLYVSYVEEKKYENDGFEGQIKKHHNLCLDEFEEVTFVEKRNENEQ